MKISKKVLSTLTAAAVLAQSVTTGFGTVVAFADGRELPATVNVDTNDDGEPDLNLDTTGNGKADVNVDVTGDNIADINIDTDGDKVADVNIDTDDDLYADKNIASNYATGDYTIDTLNAPVFTARTSNGNVYLANIKNDIQASNGIVVRVFTDLARTTQVGTDQGFASGSIGGTISGLVPGNEYVFEAFAAATDDMQQSPSVIWTMTISDATTTAAPVPVVVTKTNTSIKVSWEDVENAAKYTAHIAPTTVGITPTTSALYSGTNTEYEFTGLDANTEYDIAIYAYTDENTQSEAGTLTVTTENRETLAAPVISVNDEIVGANVALKWDAVDGASGYMVQYSADDTFATPTSQTVTATTYQSNELTSGTYYFRVKALDATAVKDESEWSNVLEQEIVNTLPPVTKLDAPTGVIVTAVSNSELEVSFIGVDLADEYLVEWSTDETFATSDSKMADSTHTHITGLDADTTYYVRVKSWDDDEAEKCSDYSATATATTLASTGIGKFTTPTLTSVHADSFSQITVSWEAVTAPAGYDLEVATDAEFTNRVFTQNIGSDFTSYTLGSLTANTTYYARVRAAYKAGTGESSEWSNVQSATTENGSSALPAAGRVTKVVATTVGSDKATVRVLGTGDWSTTNNYNRQLLVEFSTDPTFTTGVTSGTVSIGRYWDSTTVDVNNLEPDTTYYMRAHIVGNSVDDTDSDWYYGENTVTTTAPDAMPVLTPSLKLGVKQLIISIAETSGDNGWQYEVATDEEFNNIIKFGNVGKDKKSTVVSDNTMQADTTYYVRVKNLAANSHSDSDWSVTNGTTYTADTLPKNVAPVQITIPPTDIKTNQFKISFEVLDGTDKSVGGAFEVSTDPNFDNIAYRGTDTYYSGIDGFSTIATGLASGEEYYVRVKTLGDGTYLADSEWYTYPSTVTTQSLPQVDPVATVAATATGTTINVTWAASQQANSGYELQYSTAADFTSPVKLEVATDVTSKAITGLVGNTKYYVRVRVKGVANSTSNSTWVSSSATTGSSSLDAAAAPTITNIVPSYTTANVSWTASTSANSGYEVQYASSSAFADAKSLSTTSTTITLTNLTPSTTYYVRVKTIGAPEQTADSTWALSQFTTPTETLDNKFPTPTLSVTPASNNSVNASWTTTAGAQSYTLEYDTNNTFTTAKSVTPTDTNGTLNGLAEGTTYYFRVKVNSAGMKDASDWSNVVACTTTGTAAPTIKYNPVAFTEATVTGTTCLVKWTAGEANTYEFQFADEDDWDHGYATVTVANKNFCTMSGLHENQHYVIRVRVKGDANHQPSEWAYGEFTTQTEAQNSTLPKIDPVTVTIKQVTPMSATIEWTQTNNGNNSGYIVKIQGGKIGSLSNTTNSTSYTFTNLEPSTVYRVTVRVAGVEGKTQNSDATEVTINTSASGTSETLAAPTVSKSDIAATKAYLEWNRDDKASAYTLQIAEDADFTKNASIVVNNKNVGNYTITGLKKETKYYFRLKAHGAGYYADSNWTTGSFTTLLVDNLKVLDTPTFSQIIPDAETCYVSWDKTTGATGYTLEIAEDADFTQNVNKIVDKKSAYSATIGALERNKTYYLRLSAHGDDKVYSDSLYRYQSFTTLDSTSLEPARPPVLTLQPIFGGVQFRTNLDSGVSARYEICENDKFEKDVIAGTIDTKDWTKITGLRNNKKYFIRVKSLGVAGKYSQSNWTTQSFTTANNYTTTLKGTVTSDMTLQMSWLAISGADHYIVTLYDAKKQVIFEQYTPYLETETGQLEAGVYYYTLQPVADSSNEKEWKGTTFTSSNFNVTKGIIDKRSPIAQLPINIDTNGDRIPDINIDTNNDGIADLNIDTDGDYKADINIDMTRDRKPNLNIDLDNDLIPDVNVDTNSDRIADKNVSTGNPLTTTINIDWNEDGIADLNIDTNNDRRPDIEVDTTGDGRANVNLDTNNDGKPDVNVDTNGDWKADLNIDTTGDRVPNINIDTTGDGKANINLDLNGNGIPDTNIDTTGDGKANLNIDTNNDGVADVNIDTNGDGIADANIDTNGDGKADTNLIKVNHNYKALNLDLDYDGKPDLNIDTNNDGKADLNIDTDGNGIADLNIDTTGDGKADLNVDTNNDGKADLNIDLNGDGKPDLNIDTTGDGKPDTNVDINGDMVPDLNVKTDYYKYNINIDTTGDGKPNLNIDYTGDGRPDVNIDTNGDGKPELNIDTDEDGWEDLNIDTTGDGKADLNIDTNNDNKPELNIDTNNDRRPDLNIDTTGDGKPNVNIDTNNDGKPDLNIDTTGDGKADANLDLDGDGKIDEGSPIVDEDGNVFDPDDDVDVDDPEDDDDIDDPYDVDPDELVGETTYRDSFSVGLTYQIKANKDRKLKYEVIEGDVKVSSDGLVKFKSAGDAEIKVTDKNTDESEIIKLYVTKGTPAVEIPNDVDNDGSVTVKQGDRFTLFKNINYDGNVKCEVSDNSILDLSKDGTAIALKPGRVTLKFTFAGTDNFNETTKTVEVVVMSVDGITDVALPEEKEENDDGTVDHPDNTSGGGDGGDGNGNIGPQAGDVNPATGVTLPIIGTGLAGFIALLTRRRKNK